MSADAARVLVEEMKADETLYTAQPGGGDAGVVDGRR
jgi:hypothetical protein